MQGKTINGFTLQRLLGTGGMAEVWYAENKIGKKASVKLLLPKLCQDELVVSRFLTEAKVMVDLTHPNIRQVYDYGDIDGRPTIVMEYLEGDDLKARMKRGQRFTDEELVKWWNQLVDALNYTHKKGIVHRDIKPGNIFVDNEGNIKLLDFGIAKVRESISSTQTGQKLGTLMYMSPEQVRDSKHIDYRTDLYSFAVTFVHLITGKKPYNSDTTSDFDIQLGIVSKPLDMTGVPETWRNFLTPYLNKDPEQRPELRYFESTSTPVTPAGSDDEGTIVGDAPRKPEPRKPESKKPEPKKEESKAKDQPTPKTNNDKPKSKIWPLVGMGAAALLVVVLLVLLSKPKQEPVTVDPETEAYEACQTIADYRAFMSYYGRQAKHYADAKAVVDRYVEDSIAKVQQALAEEQARQQAEAERQAQIEAEKAEDAAYKKCTTVEACDKYLKTYPQGRYVEEVKKKRAKLVEESQNNNAATLPPIPSSYKGAPVAIFYFDYNSSSIKANTTLNRVAINALSDLLNTYAIKGFEVLAYDESSNGSSAKADAVVKQLKNMVKKANLNENSFSYKKTSYGFDWDRFITLLSNSSIKDKEQIIRALMNSSNKETVLEGVIMMYPQVEREILPQLRRVEVYVY